MLNMNPFCRSCSLPHFRDLYWILVLAIGFVPGRVGALEQKPTGDPRILSPDARLEKVFSEAFFTEGPAVAPDGSVYFSDITWTHQSGRYCQVNRFGV